jgi:hypothetical protein
MDGSSIKVESEQLKRCDIGGGGGGDDVIVIRFTVLKSET